MKEPLNIEPRQPKQLHMHVMQELFKGGVYFIHKFNAAYYYECCCNANIECRSLLILVASCL